VFGKNELSFITALLFSINPVNNQVSIWLNGKRYAIVAILILLAWAFKPYGIVFYLISPIWHYGGTPAALLYLFSPHKWILLLLLIPLIISYKTVIDKIGTRWERIPYGEIKRIRPKKLVILVKMFGYIFLHSLLPRKMAFYHMFMERFGFSKKDNDHCYSFNKDFWLGLPCILIVPVLIKLNWNNPLGFGLFWWVIFVFPWLQFPIGLTQAIAERTYYLPNIGLMYSLSWVLLKAPYGSYLITALFVYYLTKLWFYMPAYKDLEEFYRYSLFQFPDHFRARAHTAQRRLQEGRIFWALKETGEGLHLNPTDCTLNLLMAQCLMTVGMYQEASKYLKRAKQNSILGHEKYILKTINNLQGIIDNQLRGKTSQKIQPNEVVKVTPCETEE
jgi:hypothetical protein